MHLPLPTFFCHLCVQSLLYLQEQMLCATETLIPFMVRGDCIRIKCVKFNLNLYALLWQILRNIQKHVSSQGLTVCWKNNKNNQIYNMGGIMDSQCVLATVSTLVHLPASILSCSEPPTLSSVLQCSLWKSCPTQSHRSPSVQQDTGEPGQNLSVHQCKIISRTSNGMGTTCWITSE